MSFKLVSLGRLLNAMYAPPGARVSALRIDIRTEIKKAKGVSTSKGGDFYAPFWADAKGHVARTLDLREATEARIANNDTRKRLYPMLCDGFLEWWEDKRRQRNEPFKTIDQTVNGRYGVGEIGTVKVDNTLAFTVGDAGHRIVYPYFCEDPLLSDEAARLGLWLMSQCVEGFPHSYLRLLDVIGGRSYSIMDTPLTGNEQVVFVAKYEALMRDWDRLRLEYE